MTRGWPVVLIGCSLGLGIGAVAWAHSEEALVCVRTYQEISVDGTLNEWVRRLERSNWDGRLEVQKGEVFQWMRAVPAHVNALTARIEAGGVTSPQDFSASVYTLWDPQHLYLAAVVHDDDVVTHQTGEHIWQDDALEIWLDCRHDAVTRTLFQEDEYQLGVSPASQHRREAVGWVWRNPQPEPVRAAMRVASSRTGDGYVLEASVPWEVLQGCRAEVGAIMGFNISMVDKDEDQVWTHLAWSGTLHSDPSQFGHLYLVDAPIDLFPADVFEVPVKQAPWFEGEEAAP